MVTTAGAMIMAAATTTHASWVDVGTFAVAAAIVLAGAIGVVVARNPVHSALMLVMTLFGVAVLFVIQQASFLAAVQVIVYAGAIVVLFLFVIMFLGVDREEDVAAEPLRGQRPLAIGLIALGTTGLLLLGQVSRWTTGAPHVAGTDTGEPNVNLLGKAVYTTYLFPFEATAALLIIAVVGAVVLARRPPVTTNPEVGDEDGDAVPGDPPALDGAATDDAGSDPGTHATAAHAAGSGDSTAHAARSGDSTAHAAGSGDSTAHAGSGDTTAGETAGASAGDTAGASAGETAGGLATSDADGQEEVRS
jgi:NADH-quinone oxidoreductase subunit J